MLDFSDRTRTGISKLISRCAQGNKFVLYLPGQLDESVYDVAAVFGAGFDEDGGMFPGHSFAIVDRDALAAVSHGLSTDVNLVGAQHDRNTLLGNLLKVGIK